MKKTATQFAVDAGFDVTEIDSPHSPQGWYSSTYDPEFKTFNKFRDLVINDCIRILEENGQHTAAKILRSNQ